MQIRSDSLRRASSVYSKAARSNSVNSGSADSPDAEINALMQQTQLQAPSQSNNSNNNNSATPNPNNQNTQANGNFLTNTWDKVKSFIDKLPNVVKIGGAVLGTLAMGFVAYKGFKTTAGYLGRRNAPFGSSELKESKKNMHKLKEEWRPAKEEHKDLESANPNTDYHWADYIFCGWWTEKGRNAIDARTARKTINKNKAKLQETTEKYYQACLDNQVLGTAAMLKKREKEVKIYKQRLEESKAALKPIVERGKEPQDTNAQLAIDLAESKLKASEARLKEIRKIHKTISSNNGLTSAGISGDTQLKAELQRLRANHINDIKPISESRQEILAVMREAQPNWFERIFGHKPWRKPLEVRTDT